LQGRDMNNKEIYILIIDTSDIIHEGIKNILTDTGQFYDIHSAGNLCDIEHLNLKTKTGIVFINPALLQNQIKYFQSLKKDLQDFRWIGIVYSLIDPQILSELDSIINITDSRNSIISSVQRILNTGIQQDNSRQETLSDREIDVLKLLVEGNANKEIADKLNISTHTVISHRKNISLKTGIKSVSGLTIYAVVKNIISIDSFRE
jgi:DNA-binding NarL/FixJ family response regulator